MECKSRMKAWKAKDFTRINRYIMECKSCSRGRLLPGLSELIDTLWNVNEGIPLKKEKNTLELIDTLWNVNDGKKEEFVKKVLGINRYIMECKWQICLRKIGYSWELIDTLWNVN